jgi:hypothetical protein
LDVAGHRLLFIEVGGDKAGKHGLRLDLIPTDAG